MSEMMKLAERVEGLEGPDRGMDVLIAKAVRWLPASVNPEAWKGSAYSLAPNYWFGPIFKLPAYTASLDAAMTLVPATCLFWCRELWDDQRKAGYAGINIYRDMTHVGETTAVAATPAQALVSAALKARAHLEGE